MDVIKVSCLHFVFQKILKTPFRLEHRKCSQSSPSGPLRPGIATNSVYRISFNYINRRPITRRTDVSNVVAILFEMQRIVVAIFISLYVLVCFKFFYMKLIEINIKYDIKETYVLLIFLYLMILTITICNHCNQYQCLKLYCHYTSYKTDIILKLIK